ncbi:MAG: TetR/AcrR family transcriptional regulator [Ignavibacteriaceae bacterium]|jgi:TetR/AcrR family fatty acid metabolism transcriptional regulator
MRTKEGTKELDILEAAIKVFAEQGYHRAKISKIAELAGVAAGSVYVYFQNKEDILLKIFDSLWRTLYVELKKLSENKTLSPQEQIDSMIDLVFDTFTENPALALVFVNEQHHLVQKNEEGFTNYYESFLGVGEEVFKKGIEQNVFSENIDIKIFRYYILGALRNLLRQWAQDPKIFPLNKIRQNIKFLTKHGIKK